MVAQAWSAQETSPSTEITLRTITTQFSTSITLGIPWRHSRPLYKRPSPEVPCFYPSCNFLVVKSLNSWTRIRSRRPTSNWSRVLTKATESHRHSQPRKSRIWFTDMYGRRKCFPKLGQMESSYVSLLFQYFWDTNQSFLAPCESRIHHAAIPLAVD